MITRYVIYNSVCVIVIYYVLHSCMCCIKVWIYKTQCHVRLKEFGDALQAITRAIANCRQHTVELYILRAKLYWSKGFDDEGE